MDRKRTRGKDTEEIKLRKNDTDETVAAFLELDQNGAVDLDALFDALNIATEKGGIAVEFTRRMMRCWRNIHNIGSGSVAWERCTGGFAGCDGHAR